MSADPDVDAYLADENAAGAELFRKFHELVRECGPSDAVVSRTVVFFKRKRVFAGGFVRGKALEIVIDLLRPADHPCSIGTFPSTKKVVSNRLRIRDAHQLDDEVRALLREAYTDVGPGTR